VKKVPNPLNNINKKNIFSLKWLWLIFIGTLVVLTAIAPGSDKISIAVINLETSPNLSNRVGEVISEHIRTHLAHLYAFDVMDKNEMNDIINKQGFLRPKGCKKVECHPTLFETRGTLQFLQKCGASDHDAALEIGWMLGVEKVLIGLVNKLDERYTISVKIIDTFTREVDVADQISFHYKIQDLEMRIEELAARLAEKISIQEDEMVRPVKEGPHTADSKGTRRMQNLNLEEHGEIKDMKDFMNIIQEKMRDKDSLDNLNKGKGEEGLKPKAIESASGKLDLSVLEEMAFIPAGPFKMGSDEFEEEGPAREVYVDAFYIDKYEVTNVQYEKFWKSTGHRPPLNWGKPGFNGPDQPVTGVSWEDAADYAAWAGKRLPSEAEWEKAARGTDSRRYPWGNKWSEGRCRSGNKNSTSGPVSVGSHPDGASPYGCHDMAGNAWEWCADWFMADYYSQAENRNPKGPQDGSWHVLRGGGRESAPDEVRTSFRQGGCPGGGYRCAGFRCVRDLGKARGNL
jgi:iron(II)-dependent oxidoreductase